MCSLPLPSLAPHIARSALHSAPACLTTIIACLALWPLCHRPWRRSASCEPACLFTCRQLCPNASPCPPCFFQAMEARRKQNEIPWLVLLAITSSASAILLAIVLHRLMEMQ